MSSKKETVCVWLSMTCREMGLGGNPVIRNLLTNTVGAILAAGHNIALCMSVHSQQIGVYLALPPYSQNSSPVVIGFSTYVCV